MINDRYKFSTIELNNQGKRIYDSTIYPVIVKDINDIYIIAQDTERLDMLAYRYYGDSRSWWIIAAANNIGKGSLMVKAGTQLRIPQNLTNITSDLDRLQVTK